MTKTTTSKVAVPGKAEYELSPNVVFLPVQDGTARLLDMGGKFYAIGQVGAEMLKGILDQGVEATVIRLAGQYEVEPRRIQKDLHTLLDDLRSQGLICNRQEERKPRTGGGWPALILVPAIRLVYRLRRSWDARAAALLTLARLSFACFGWTRTVAAWRQSHLPLDVDVSEDQAENAIKAVDKAVRGVATRHLFKMACKERALCCWSMLRWSGLPATLVVGVELFPLAGHCWCEVGPRTLSDFSDRCEMFTPVIRYQ